MSDAALSEKTDLLPRFAWRPVGVVVAVQVAVATALSGRYERYGPAQPYSGHMSYADWGPPSDSMTGPVLLVGNFGENAAIRRYLTDCHVVAVHDNGIGLDNDEQGTTVTLCSPVSQPWSRIWPALRHYY